MCRPVSELETIDWVDWVLLSSVVTGRNGVIGR